MFHPLFILLILLFLSGCSTKEVALHPKSSAKISTQQEIKSINKNPNWIRDALYKEYKKWHKTPYKFGGIDTNGVDCSSLMQSLYRDAFGIEIARTTSQQAREGYLISKKSTKEGDLVLFKMGNNIRHAGIIIEKGKFIHSSKKSGVKISNLNNPYWKSRYWQSRRILP